MAASGRLDAQVAVVLGSQWGDEGKGKLVDILSKQYDIVARAQGGANAGHTIYDDAGNKCAGTEHHLHAHLHASCTCAANMLSCLASHMVLKCIA